MFRHTTVTVRLTQLGDDHVAIATTSHGEFARASRPDRDDAATAALRAALAGQEVLRAVA